jgi:hypothetical protein
MARLVTAQLSFDFENGGGHDHLQGIQR